MARGRRPPRDAHDRRPKGKVQKKKPDVGLLQPPSFGGDPRLDPPTLFAPKRTALQRKEIIRRQMLLRDLGYKIVTDGVWGPRSQHAWKNYLKRQRTGDLQVSPYKKEGGRVIAPDVSLFTRERKPKGVPADVITPREQELAQERAVAERQEALRKERVKVIAEQKAQILDRANLLRLNPDWVTRLPLRKVVEVLIDKEANLGNTPEGIRVLQTWLISRGYQNVKTTGSYDKATHEAVKLATERAETLARKKSVDSISGDLYAELGVQPGDAAPWLPGGKVPTPKELDAILKRGGFTAGLLLRSMLQRWKTVATNFDQMRTMALIELAAKNDPMIQRALALGIDVNLLWAYSSILSHEDLTPFPDLTELEPGMTPEEVLEERRKNAETRAENAQRVLLLRARAKTLLLAKDEKDYEVKQAAILKEAEDAFKEFQQKMARENLPWWGQAIEAVLWPGEMMRQTMVWAAANAPRWQMANVGGAMTIPVPVGPSGYTTWERADQIIDEMPLAERVVFELVFDPLNFVAPLRWASTGLRFATRAGTEVASLGTYRLARGERIWQTALKYEKGTWSKYDTFLKAGRMSLGNTSFEPAVEAVAAKVVKFTQLKEVAFARANNRVRVAMRHLFKAPTDPAARKAWKGGKGLKPHFQARIDRAAIALDGWLETSPELKVVVDSLVSDRASLYVSSDYGEVSQIGAAFLANLTEKSRVSAVHRMATDEVLAQRDAMIEAAGGIGAMSDAAKSEMDSKLAEIYRSMIDEAGVYITGGRAVGEEAKAMAKAVMDRTLGEMDDLENILMPAFQRIIERRLAKEGFTLWDDTGKWLGVTDEAAESVRALAAHSFDDEALPENIPNPAYGVGHTLDEFIEAVEFEVRRGLPRIYGYQARHLAAGTLPENWSADAAANKLRDDVRGAWTRHADGLYYDEREFLEVSALYARQHHGAFQVLTQRAEELRRGVSGNFVDDLAALPALSVSGDLDKGLWEFMWMKGNGFRSQLPGGIGSPARFTYGPDTRGLSGEAARVRMDKYNLRRQKLYDVMNEAREALAAGADSLFPRELAREGLYMAALAKSQAWYLKGLYIVLYGTMAVWRFATLPLRLGWVVRNVLDNQAKAMLRAIRDPRLFFAGAARPGSLGRSIFDNNIAVVRQAAVFLDRLFGTDAARHFDAITAQFWSLNESVINKVLGAHGLRPVPEIALRDARMTLMENGLRIGRSGGWFRQLDSTPIRRGRYHQLARDVAKRISDTPDLLWDMMAITPESWAKRVIYRSKYASVYRQLSRSEEYLVPRAVQSKSAVDVPVYHGTTSVFESFDPALLDSEDALLYGQGFYFTEDPKIASEYAAAVRGGKTAAERGTPNVRVHRLTIEKPLDLDARLAALPMSEREAILKYLRDNKERIVPHVRRGGSVRLPGGSWHVREIDDTFGVEETLDQIETILREFDDDPLGELVSGRLLDELGADEGLQYAIVPSSLWQDAFRSLGYDGFTHKGGHIVGTVPHRVWIAWDVSQIHPVWETGHATEMVVDETALSLAAHRAAWDEVVHTLFDYSKITVIEDNLKVFFPFIQFWQKNLRFWTGELAGKPWLAPSIVKLDQERQESHKDLPPWLQRYIGREEIVDAAAVVPGLDEVVDAMLPENAMIDPVSMTSFAPLYRAYRSLAYGDNALLPGENPGLKVIAPMIDAMNDFGLSMNPLVRKPLEAMGISSQRAWQSIFPQTPLIEAFTREYLGDGFRKANWEQVFERLPWNYHSDAIAENFEFFVQQEIAGQIARGEQPDRDAAEDTIRAWFLTQNVWGYFSGLYWRRATPEDIYLSKLSIEPFDDMTDREKSLRQIWSMRGMDRMTFDRYLVMLPAVQAYYAQDDWEQREKMLEENPELRRYVSPEFTGRVFGGEWYKNVRRHTETQLFFRALEIVDDIDPAPDVREAAEDIFATKELRAYWKENDTPKKIRQRQVKGEVQRYFRDLNRDYFSIPETDYEARNGFVQEHPELIRYWNRNNDPVDDYEALTSSLNAHLREQYFALIEEKGFDGAAWLLKRHPFMFEDTKSANKVNEKTGTWKIGIGKDWSAERISDFREAKPHLTWFFDTFLPKMGKKKAFAWLYDSKGDIAKIIRSYMDKYPSERRQAWMQAAPWLKIYFGLPPEEKGKWLSGTSEGAAIVRSYFATYGKRGISRHALDYIDAKDELDFYFSMPKEKRSEWLNGDDPRAKTVLAYFKKYGREHAYEKLIKKYPNLANGTPEQRRRMEFWRGFFALTPDKRPEYVIDKAEAHGVFIYGEFGEQQRYDSEMEFMRRAVGSGVSERQAAYLYVRPLLKFYRTLSPEEKPIFLRANPEVQEYFDKFSKKSMTGNEKLDGLVEQYFKLPADSPARSQFLKRHPEVQDWFDSRSSPAERAVRNSLEQYFGLGTSWERKEYLLDHPEIQAYFERRRDEKALESSIYRAFDHSDPRLEPFYESAADLERAARRMREKLQQRAYKEAGSISLRRERRGA